MDQATQVESSNAGSLFHSASDCSQRLLPDTAKGTPEVASVVMCAVPCVYAAIGLLDRYGVLAPYGVFDGGFDGVHV